MKKILFLLLCFYSFQIFAQIKPVLPLPSQKQLKWQELEYYGFVHFNMNTFTNVEWGEGKESPQQFNPKQLDCEQWVKIAKSAGMKGLILTVKHHDGFTLYPSKFTDHNISKSPWKNGKGDVLMDLSKACKKYGILLGVYLSPWDRFHPAYGTEAYNQVYVNMQKEILQNYGSIFEFWYDGANGEGPNGKKQIYDWPLFNGTVEKLMPNAIQFSDSGPDIRWVGNEKGFAYDETWSPINKNEIYPGFPKFDNYKNGQINGSHWVPVEVDVSIRPGWYYHPEQDNKVKTPDSLMKIYVASVGRNGNLLLNIPVDNRGLIHPNDSTALLQFAELRKKSLKNLINSTNTQIDVSSLESNYSKNNLIDLNKKTFWAAKSNDSTPSTTLNFKNVILANSLVIQEPIFLGQRIAEFEVILENEKGEKETIKAKTVGNKRILTFNERLLKSVKIVFLKSKAQVLISNIELYRIISKRNESLFQ
ncbi:glycoside hydrolase family 29 (alpha-L-fucosidase) [Sandaracinomonas limnophila]|uniref:alpha-L-fucosidase n=1 Tax=Sandaracinomonas limnophila TaxID=1862386 RepID=A0A437PWM2_9BACT|nr:alpha-L-fucosidase [Sandaracinomonas limnophila]RVU26667.1 glycoside hydrolase family 29 (alpha-L-fucosidase) [Sandaracinomonas limnophila]